MKDPLIIDRLLDKYGEEITRNFCIVMCTLARDQGCILDGSWWEEALDYITIKNKAHEENTSCPGLRESESELS